MAVDTIAHPAYRRLELVGVGPFDETLERNSDYELNYRLRAAGHTLVFDPDIASEYRPRASLSELARQFWWYGRWKVRVIERHPRSLRWRHLVSPVAVVGAAFLPSLLRGRRTRPVAIAGVAGYAGVVAFGVVASHPTRHQASVLTLAGAFPVMHAAWGAGFVTSVMQDTLRIA
jgi:hypothetical protein